MRVANSSYFCKGPKLRAFLLYVCENTIHGGPENVREQLIGSKVFGRAVDYVLNEDNIVRVEARELRKRLEAYFANEGKNEPIVIDMPKGAYVPVFRPREEAALPPAESEPEEQPPPAVAVPAAPGRSAGWLAAALAIGLLISLIVSLWLLAENRRLRQIPNDAGAREDPRDYSIYSDLLGTMGRPPNREAQLVLCNPKVVLFFGSMAATPEQEPAGGYARTSKDLEAVFGAAYNGNDTALPFHFFQITTEKYTGTGEAMAAFSLGRLMDSLHRSVHLTQARFINWDNIQQEDVILLGGPSANDWTSHLELQSDFQFPGLSIINVRPLPGEPKEYVSDAIPAGGGPMAEYGFMRMHTTPHGFRTFVLAGLSGAGTAGVAEFFASPAKMKPVADRIAAAAPGQPFPSDWEVLIRVVVQDRLPVESSVVTLRPVRTPTH